MIRIVLIDHQEQDRRRILSLLSPNGDFEIAGAAGDGYEAIKLIAEIKPEIALMDLNIPMVNGADMISMIKCRSPETAIILFTNLETDENIQQVIREGLSGYLIKNHDMDRLPEAIREVAGGGSFISPRITANVIRLLSRMAYEKNLARRMYPIRERMRSPAVHFSRYEMIIMRYIAEGMTNKEIGDRLLLKAGTVRNHITAILQKTSLRDRTQVAIYTLRYRLNRYYLTYYLRPSGAGFDNAPGAACVLGGYAYNSLPFGSGIIRPTDAAAAIHSAIAPSAFRTAST
jgi:DNA-binding NarL/FixJ family response regulator